MWIFGGMQFSPEQEARYGMLQTGYKTFFIPTEVTYSSETQLSLPSWTYSLLSSNLGFPHLVAYLKKLRPSFPSSVYVKIHPFRGTAEMLFLVKTSYSTVGNKYFLRGTSVSISILLKEFRLSTLQNKCVFYLFCSKLVNAQLYFSIFFEHTHWVRHRPRCCSKQDTWDPIFL